ncbi:MAG: lipid kinase [Rhizobiaceae bacterium]
MRRKKALLIANPKSRNGQMSLDRVVEQMKDKGFDIVRTSINSSDDISSTIIANRRSVQLVICAGGDGTMRAAAAGLVETGLPLGVLPTGTANDLARTLEIPFDMQRATDVITGGKLKTIDIGKVNDHYFFNVASIGLSSEVTKSLTPETKKRFGRFGYTIAALKALTTSGSFTAEIINKGERVNVRTLQIAVGNGKFYGGGNAVEADAAIDDGHLDLYSLEFDNVWKLALMLRSFRAGSHGLWEEVRTAKCVNFEIRTSRPRSINLDGEIMTKTPANFSVVPNAVKVFVPG